MVESNDRSAEFAALQAVVSALQPLDAEARLRIFETAATFFGLNAVKTSSGRARPTAETPDTGSPYPAFSADMSMSPKEFVLRSSRGATLSVSPYLPTI